MVFLYFTCKFIHEQFSPSTNPPNTSLGRGGHPSFPILIPAPEKTRSFPHHKTTRDKRKTTFTALLSLFDRGILRGPAPKRKKRTKLIGLSFQDAGENTTFDVGGSGNGMDLFPPFPQLSSPPPPVGIGTVRGQDTQRKGGRREIDGCHTLDSGPPASEKGKRDGKSVGQWATPQQSPIPPSPVTSVIREQALCDPGVETCPESLARFLKNVRAFGRNKEKLSFSTN